MFSPDNLDSAVVPKLAATIILVRDSSNGIEVLITKRNSKASFLGGFWVFPGGGVETEDAGDTTLDTLKNAAARETREEAGLIVNTNDLLYVSQWITPPGPPKRYDTHFFIVPATEDAVDIDGHEVVDAEWVTAASAIELHENGQIEMMPPTLLSFMGIQSCERVDDVVARYQNKPPFSISPKPCFADDQLVMLYPGDAGFDAGEPAEAALMHRCLHVNGTWQYINTIGFEL
ncbi:Uncharacterised protein [BD1-7 clade bacterium]|uniref:Nudix hydrolase domain-containing protein n=1 Tax=BD1-7 clade bacterium TaxID=2029982 RepID=A0A5S9QCY8_9GAMM|nr:Uncharacterised protein [BD1-7 clade bacterium]